MSALAQSEERREFRRISDAIAMQMTLTTANAAANEQEYKAVELPNHPTHVVSLSPNGLKCYHTVPFNKGDIIRLSMKFFPSNFCIETTAKVVNTGEEGTVDKANRFFAGIAFQQLSEEDQNNLLDHINQVACQSFGGAVKLIY